MTRPTSRRIVWGLVDQGLASAVNFGGSVLAASALTTEAFGAYAIAFAIYLLGLGVSRSWSSEPLLIRHSATEHSQPQAIRAAAGAALTIGLVTGFAGLLIGMSLGGPTGSALVALGPLLPGLLLHDLTRFALIMASRPAAAALNDLCWFSAMVVCFVVAPIGKADTAVAIWSWGAGASIGAIVGLRQLRALPRPRDPRWWRENRKLGFRYSVEFLLITGSTFAMTIGIAALGDLRDAAGFRGAQVVMGPVNILFFGASMQALPVFVRQASRDPKVVLRSARILSTALVLCAATWGAAAAALPESVGEALLGRSWIEARPLVPVFALIHIVSGATSGATVGLRSFAAASTSLSIRAVLAPAIVLLGTMGAVLGGAAGAAAGLALANALAIPAWWTALGRLVQSNLPHAGTITVR